MIINVQSKEPIYEQIVLQIKSKIKNGELTAGDSLPAIRTLAKDLKVSVITVKKAYEILQIDGLIMSVVGRGTVIADVKREMITKNIEQDVEIKIKELMSYSQKQGMNKRELINLFKRVVGDIDE
ncbi:GntR family transcriptional regulator [Dolosigranulum pigrum]|uniref:GntR family transcriptional regulator n=1 Tax=Dolosigranulum pigrum TaxID=29394 RepID=UPI001FCA5DC0|nr:GntR family transcriptional regulator [Dolosigranulum pigrum]